MSEPLRACFAYHPQTSRWVGTIWDGSEVLAAYTGHEQEGVARAAVLRLAYLLCREALWEEQPRPRGPDTSPEEGRRRGAIGQARSQEARARMARPAPGLDT